MAGSRVKKLVSKVASPYLKRYGGGRAYGKQDMKKRGSMIRKIVARRIKMERGVGNINRNVGGKDIRTSF